MGGAPPATTDAANACQIARWPLSCRKRERHVWRRPPPSRFSPDTAFGVCCQEAPPLSRFSPDTAFGVRCQEAPPPSRFSPESASGVGGPGGGAPPTPPPRGGPGGRPV